MARSYRYLHLDVFTGRLFGGNQLAVFLDARGLPTGSMQAIANEMHFSESTFVLPPERPDTDVRVRIFTPDEEMPMAGHPTIGTAFALARSGVLEPGRPRVTFGLNVGPTRVDLAWQDDALTFAWMTQQRPEFGGPLNRPLARAALGLPADPDAGASGLPPVQMVSCGVPFVLVPLASREEVDGAALDRLAYEAFRRESGIPALPVFLFSREPPGSEATVYSRMFAPGLGIAEDPATGAASGPLGCYLVRHRLVRSDQAGRILSLQGVKMGRPSHVHVAIDGDGEKTSSVRVGGEAVLAGEGTLYI